jgi:hypothetical protein
MSQATGHAIHPMDEVPPAGKRAVYGFQYVLVFLIANLRLQDLIEEPVAA